MRTTTALILLAAGALIAESTLAAPTINMTEACVDGTGFEFVVDFNEPVAADPIQLRIDAEADPFGPDATEHISVNFDAADGVVDLAVVETFGTPDFDYWLDGPIGPSDLTVTDLDFGSWRVAGRVANGTDLILPGDEIAFFAVSTQSGTTSSTNVPVAVCASAEPSFVSEVILDGGAPWTPDLPGDTVATNGDGVVVEPLQPINITMGVNLNDVDTWACTGVFLIDGVIPYDIADHADASGAGVAFASFSIPASPATGVYEMQLLAFSDDECVGNAIATMTLTPGAVEVMPPAVAVIDPTATIGNNVTFGGAVTIDAFAVIGDRVFLGDQAHIGANTSVGPDAIIDDGTIIGTDSSIGAGGKLTFLLNGIFTPTIVGDDVTVGPEALIVAADIDSGANIGARVEVRSLLNGIFAPAVVGLNAAIGDDSTIVGSAIRKDASIGANVDVVALLNGIFIPSTIGKNSAIGDGSLIEGTLIKKDSTLATAVIIGQGSQVDESASIGEGTSFGLHTLIKRNVIVGDNVDAGDDVAIRQGAQLGSDIEIGNNVDLGKNCSVGNSVIIGNNVTVIPGASVPDFTDIPDGSTFP